jgi:pimeloyl-ACP methyl ester carboxylesterase
MQLLAVALRIAVTPEATRGSRPARSQGDRFGLSALGYDAYGWGLGRNLGGVARMRTKLRARLAEIHAKTGETVSMIGWSLGGVYARDLALAMPEVVRSVVTLGSRSRAARTRATSATSTSSSAAKGPGTTSKSRASSMRSAGNLPMPSTSI